MNMSTDKAFQGTRLTFAPGGWLSEWDCRKGKVYNLGRNPGVVVRDFAPSQEHLFVVSSSPLGGSPEPDGACIPFPGGKKRASVSGGEYIFTIGS